MVFEGVRELEVLFGLVDVKSLVESVWFNLKNKFLIATPSKK